MKQPAAKLIRLPDVMARTGLSRSSVYVAVKAGKLAPPVKIGARSVAWLDSDADQFIADRVAERAVRQA